MLLAVFAVLRVSPCQNTPSSFGSHGQAQSQSAGNRELSVDARTCKDFVQKFYDWYWNRFAAQADNPNFDNKNEPNVWTVLKDRPSVLSPKLRRLLADEEKQMRATHEIGNLDFDPFWGNQDAQGQYAVGHVIVTTNRCEATIPQGHVVAEVEKSSAGWQFANFRYSFYSEDGKTKRFPDENLVQILTRKD